MSFTQDDVKKLAHLARIDTNENSFGHSIVEDLGNILQLVNKICDINTDNVTALDHNGMQGLVMREDVVTELNVREQMQSLVTEEARSLGLYLVPKVVE